MSTLKQEQEAEDHKS